MLLLITGQFEILPGYSMAAPFLPIRILILFLAFFSFKGLRKIFFFKECIFLTGCVLAAFYFSSVIRKVNFEWIWYDQIIYLLSSSYVNGWLSDANIDQINSLEAIFGWFNIPLKMFTILKECGMLFLFYKTKWARALLFGAIFLHIGILWSAVFCFGCGCAYCYVS